MANMDISRMPNKRPVISFDCFSNVGASGYGGVYQNFTIALLKKHVNLVGMDRSVKPDVQIYLGQPDRRWRSEWERKADVFGVFTMFETEVLPGHWVEDINEHCDFVIVPSKWCKEIFEKGGISKPIFIVPLGINPAMFPYLEHPKREMFTILWQGFHGEDRKGYASLDKAFEELNLPNARLIKKISPFSLRTMVQWEFRTDRWSICKNMKPAELLMLLREADLSVNPTSGEGFGLIPLEHMATGLPVLVSENTGCLDYRNAAYNIGIKCDVGKSWFGEGFGDTLIPNYKDLKAKIKWAYEEREQIREMGKQASEWVHREWTYEKATDKLLEVLNEFIS